MDEPSSPAQHFPITLKYLHTLLTAAEDTHEARANVFYTYDSILFFALESEGHGDDSHNLALSVWTSGLRERVSTPSGFFNQVWQELVERRDDLVDYIYAAPENQHQEKVFMGLRVDDHAHFLFETLQSGYNKQFTDFVAELVEEQPQYFDRPSDVDSLIQQRTHSDYFPTLAGDMLVLVKGGEDSETWFTVIFFLVHHIAYICDLFKKTDFAPSAEVIEALAEYRINPLSRMFADPTSHIPLKTRTHCASINHRSVHDFVVLRAKELLQSTDREYLNWQMYKWLLRCVERAFKDKDDASKLFRDLDLAIVTDPATFAQPNYVPALNTVLVVPDHIVQEWQDYDLTQLKDVEFEATGRRILVKNVARPVQPETEATCTVCLEFFAVRKSSTVAWKIGCGHMFHEHCLRSMINGIEKNSNCCPLCRAEICMARERRRIVYTDDEAEEKAEEEDPLGADADV